MMNKLKWIWLLALVAVLTTSPFSTAQAQFTDSLHYRFSSDTAVWDEELAAYTITLDFEMKWDVPDRKVNFISAVMNFNTTFMRFHSAVVDSSNWWEKFKVISVDSSTEEGRIHIEWDTPNDDTTISFTTGSFIRYGFMTLLVDNQSKPFEGGITNARSIGNHAKFIATWFMLDSNYIDGTPVFLGVTETPCCNTPGDANNNGQVNISDVTHNIARIFAGGAPAPCLAEADADANATLNIADITFMIARIFAGGPAPSCVSTIP